MSDHNLNDRVYVRVPKPLDEMTPDEIHDFAEDTYVQIMKLMRGGEDTQGACRLGQRGLEKWGFVRGWSFGVGLIH